MFHKLFGSLALLILILNSVVFSQNAESSTEIKSLLEYHIYAHPPLGGGGIYDEKKEQLVAFGETAYPILFEYLEQASDPFVALKIFSLFVAFESNRTPLVEKTRYYLDDPREDVKRYAILTLGKIGSVSDCELLLPIMEDSTNNMLSGAATISLGKLGDLNTILRMEPILVQRSEGLTQEQIEADRFIQRGYRAIEQIRERVRLEKEKQSSEGGQEHEE